MNNIREMAHNLQAETIAFRRDLHKNPEPSMEEFRTTDKVAAALDAMGVSYRRLDPPALLLRSKAPNPIPTRSSPCGLTWTP